MTAGWDSRGTFCPSHGDLKKKKRKTRPDQLPVRISNGAGFCRKRATMASSAPKSPQRRVHGRSIDSPAATSFPPSPSPPGLSVPRMSGSSAGSVGSGPSHGRRFTRTLHQRPREVKDRGGEVEGKLAASTTGFGGMARLRGGHRFYV